MKYTVKKKLIDGRILFGIIDEDLNEVLPFEYLNIEERTYNYHDSWINKKNEPYFVVCNQDNKKGIFADGGLILKPSYDDADLIPYGGSIHARFIVGKQTEECMQYGILERQPENGNECEYVMIYPFGKADKIKLESNKIMLYKNESNRVLRGIFGDPQLGTQDPIYTQLDVCVYKPSNYPIMPNPKHVFVEKDVQWNFGFQDWDITYVKVGKLKNNEEVKGILTKTPKCDGFTSSRNQSILNELVPCEYSDCEIDTQKHLIMLLQIKDGKQLKGLMGYSTCWHICTEGSLVEGYCGFTPEFTIPCEYDDIRLLHDAIEGYFIVTKNGKVGLIKAEFSTVRGPYDARYKSLAKTEVLLDCKYDNISRLPKGDFILTIDDKKGLLVDGMRDKYGNLLKINCEYKSIEYTSNDSNLFVITNFDGKKSVFTPREEQRGYKFKSTPFKYDSISDEGLLKCSKKSKKGFKHDIYNHSLGLIVSGVDSVEYESNMHKLVAKTDENNIRIIFVAVTGDILFDEQGNNISVSYCESLRTFLVANNGILQIRYSKKDREHNNTKTNIQGDYTTFDIIGDSKQIKYRKKSDTGDSKYGLYKFERSSCNGVITVEPVLNDEYESIDTVLNGTRSIVSKVSNGDDQTLKYGVMENNQGNRCIPIEYDSIVLGKDGAGNEAFVTTNMVNGVLQQFVFDTDGFVIGDNTVSDGSKRLVLTNNSNN